MHAMACLIGILRNGFVWCGGGHNSQSGSAGKSIVVRLLSWKCRRALAAIAKPSKLFG
jgi:hypothetical protein